MAYDTDLQAYLKIIYPGGKIPELQYRKRPLLDMIPKKDDFGGLQKDQSVMTRTAKRGSHSPDVAFAATDTQQTYARFNLTVAEDYQNVYLPRKEMVAAAVRKDGSFGNLVKDSVEAGRQAMLDKVCRQLYQPGLGSVGQIQSLSGVTFKCNPVRNHRYLNDGDVLQFDSADGTSGAVHAGTATVTNVNRATGVVTCGTTFLTGAITGIADEDYCFLTGNFGKGMYGLQSWLGTSPTTLYGLNRSTGGDHLLAPQYTIAGNRVDGFINAMDEFGQQSDAVPTHIFVNSLEFANLAKENTSITIQAPNGRAGVGFKAIELYSNISSDPIMIVGDNWCPSNRAFAFTLREDCICLESMKPLVHRQEEYTPIAANLADAYSIRLSSYPVLNVKRPNAHMMITLQ